MDSNIYAFIISGWGILLNIGLLMALLAFAYDKYAKRWGATTGRFSTTGKITWSEYGGLGSSSLYDTTLISYTYRINNKAYNGTLKGKIITQKQVDANPRGKEVRIFYAPRDPNFSTLDHPPRLINLVAHLFAGYLLFPILFINTIVSFIYALF